MIAENGQAADLLKITSRLIDVLEREIEMLRAMRPSEMQSLQQDKIMLAAAYESAIHALEADPAAAQLMAPSVRAELHEVTERFHRVLSTNEQALRAAREATNRMLKHIVAEAQKQQHGPATYGPASLAAAGRNSARRPGVSLTFDQRL